MTQEIDPHILTLLQGHCSEIIYQRDEVVIYEGHVPRVGFIVLEGKMEIIMSKTKKEVNRHNAVGVKELALNSPFKYTVKIYPNTRVIALDKSTLTALSEGHDEVLKDFANMYLGLSA